MSRTDREADARRSGSDWFFEAVSAIAVLTAAVDVAMRWNVLPERIPTHFDAAGHPNGWGSKDGLLMLLGATVAMAIVLTIAENYQRLINIPIRLDRGSPAVRRLLRSMVIVLKAVITVTFVWITDLTMRASMGDAAGLGRAFLPVFLGATFGPVIYYLVKLKRL